MDNNDIPPWVYRVVLTFLVAVATWLLYLLALRW